VSTIYKLVAEGKVPGVKIGRHWRFHRKALERMFQQQKKKKKQSRVKNK